MPNSNRTKLRAFLEQRVWIPSWLFRLIRWVQG